MDPIIFDVEGIKKLLENLGCKKANGPDDIPTRLIKNTASEIAEVVCFVFNQSYSLSQLPTDWCKANGNNHSRETQLLLTIEDLGRIWMRDMKLIYRFFISARPLTRYPTRDYSQN